MNYFLSFFLAFLSGVIIGNIWIDTGIWVIFSFVVILLFWHIKKGHLVFIVLSLVFGFFYTVHIHHTFEEDRQVLGELVGWGSVSHSISGTAGELLSTSTSKKRYRMTITHIDQQPTALRDVALLLAVNLSVNPGDTVEAFGKFSFPRDTVDYAAEKSLWNRGMIAEFNTYTNKKISPEKYGFFVRLQQWFSERLSLIFPQSGQTLLSGILLGQRSDMDTDLRDKLRNSGLMHLMVVSGGNVMMLIIFLSLFVRSIPVILRFCIIGGTIGAFVLLVGGDAPVWRAALMGVIGYAGQLVGRRFPSLFLPFLVGSFLALVNPLSIVYDIGLQLSFLSVICIIIFGKPLTHFFRFLGPFFAEATSLTVAATLGTLPITLYYFGTFSLVSPLANLLAAPAIPVLMYGGIATLFASTFSLEMSYFIGYIPWIATTYLYRIIDIFGSLGWSSLTFELGAYKPYFITASLGLMIILVSHYQKKDRH